MGSGRNGGFGNTIGSQDYSVSLPKNDSQLKHIFRNKAGHLPDTPENRKLLLDLANDKSKFRGVDKWGNHWNVRENEDGTQDLVEYRDGVIHEGGRNTVPIQWNSETGLNYNPNNPQMPSTPVPTTPVPTTPVTTHSANPFIIILERGDIA